MNIKTTEEQKAEAIENLNQIKERVVLKVLNDLEIGKLFYLNNAKGLYFHLGYKKLKDFVYSLNMDFNKVRRIMYVYEKYIVKLEYDIDQLKKYTINRLYAFAPYSNLIDTDDKKEKFLKFVDPNNRHISKTTIKYVTSKKVQFKSYKEMESTVKKIHSGDLIIRNSKKSKPDEIKNLRDFLILLKSETFPNKLSDRAKISRRDARKAVDYLIKIIER
jgi:hypothetical protein